MWNLVVLFIGTVLTTILISHVESSPFRDIDVATILNVLTEQQNQNEHFHSHKHEQVLESKSSEEAIDNEDNSHYGSLKSSEILELMEQATQNKDSNDISSDYKEITNKKHHDIHKFLDVQDVDEENNKLKPQSKSSMDESTIKQILMYMQNKIKPKEKPRKQAVKNRKLVSKLFNSLLEQGGERNDRTGVIEDYSKIYVIFNPLGLQKNSNTDRLNDVISKISSSSFASSPKERAGVKKDVRYKGFSVKQGVFSRRARRDSKEKYDPKDSMEDYKQKRARNDHGSGRTAIPYIRHRGDIYERDN